MQTCLEVLFQEPREGFEASARQVQIREVREYSCIPALLGLGLLESSYALRDQAENAQT